jgi:outer membrane lipoprotein-sorting protein
VLREAGCADPSQAAAEPSPAAKTDAKASADDEQRQAAKRAAAGVAPSPEPAQTGTVIQKRLDPAQQAKLDQLMATPVIDTYWIDKQTFVLLRAEQNLGPKGTSVYEVSSASFGISVPDSTFDFAPVPGAHMLASAADIKRTLAAR